MLYITAVILSLVLAAPAPFPRPGRADRPLCRADLVGKWAVHWGTVPAVFILSGNGDFLCHWPGVRYVGSWGLKKDMLWITESNRPEIAGSWQSYAIRLKRHDPAMPIYPKTDYYGPVKVGATGVMLWMKRGKP